MSVSRLHVQPAHLHAILRQTCSAATAGIVRMIRCIMIFSAPRVQALCDYVDRMKGSAMMFDFPTKGILQVGQLTSSSLLR
jgi:hypothetical protein